MRSCKRSEQFGPMLCKIQATYPLYVPRSTLRECNVVRDERNEEKVSRGGSIHTSILFKALR